LTIASPGDSTLTINFAWDNDNDNDMLIIAILLQILIPCGVQEVQLSNPEIDHSIWLEDPTGDYYVTVLDYDAGVDFNYTFLFNTA
jgi:hypothetical protein